MNDLLLLETEHSTMEQAHSFRVPGYLIVQPKVACRCLAELDPAQAADLFACMARAESVVNELIRPARVYVLKFGEESPQVHFHVIPRTARVEAAYLADVPDGKPYSGARIVDWVWCNHASLGHADDQIQAFVREARMLVQRAGESAGRRASLRD